ncbi:MAG TPA: hypothetical protein VL334_01105 [Anaerolineae bacterium]|nr:hypothetical protein [Anaerolineae bacterium]
MHSLQRSHTDIQAGELGLDLGDDAVLFGEGSKSNSRVLQEIRGNTQLPGSTSETRFSVSAKHQLTNKIEQPFRNHVLPGCKYMEFSRTEPPSAYQAACNRSFAVLHARCDFGKQHVALRKRCEALPNIAQPTLFWLGDPPIQGVHRRHWQKSHGQIIGKFPE